MSETDTPSIVPVILSGGSGSRLWPKSRKAYPKQLHCLYGDHTMIQHTALRVKHLQAPIVVCNEDQRFMVAEQLREVCEQKPDILLEPVGRNTAPAIAAAAYFAQSKYTNPILVILSADHLIKDVDAFRQTLDTAIAKARSGKLVTFGIVPTDPETGYGYIRANIQDENEGAGVEQFVEKPNAETAEKYFEEGGYYWNSGMFVFDASHFLDEMENNNSTWLPVCKASVDKANEDLDFIRLEANDFSQCKNISIDYALMEHTSQAWVVSLDAGWSDLGSWESLWQASEKDEQGNASYGDTWIKDCKNSLVHGDGNKLVAVIGLENVAVIDTDDALLVIDVKNSQQVKHIVDWLKQEKRSECEHHRKVYRPWGSVDSIDSAERYQVKRIEVKPGKGIALQMHHHRAEHWVVVKGTALVTKGEEEKLISENESIYIPFGEKHSIKNPGKLSLHVVEVQSGKRFGKDDVVRYEDAFLIF